MTSRGFLQINLALGAFVAATNGAAAMMMVGDASQWSIAQVAEATLFALGGCALLLLGLLGLSGRLSVPQALTSQTGALAGLIGLLTIWGMSILVRTAHASTEISWMVGILSALSIYSFHLARHVLPPERFRSIRAFAMPLCGLAILVDLAVFAKVGWL